MLRWDTFRGQMQCLHTFRLNDGEQQMREGEKGMLRWGEGMGSAVKEIKLIENHMMFMKFP